MSMSEPGHGNSAAAWSAVIVMLVAIVVGTLAFWFNMAWLVWACAGLLVIGGILGLILKRMGYGVNGAKITPKAHS
jgi:hypothetical protein